jgi:hypothetical protein
MFIDFSLMNPINCACFEKKQMIICQHDACRVSHLGGQHRFRKRPCCRRQLARLSPGASSGGGEGGASRVVEGSGSVPRVRPSHPQEGVFQFVKFLLILSNLLLRYLCVPSYRHSSQGRSNLFILAR